MHLSAAYLKVLREMHAVHPWGTYGWRYLNDFLPAFNALGCSSLLDYGSGIESLRQAVEACKLPIDVRCFDPAIEGREAAPEPADYVVCTDVMEHVEVEFVPQVLQHIHTLAVKGAFLNIGLAKARRVLPDGRNAHITLKPATWWLKEISKSPWAAVETRPGRKLYAVWLRK
jgi:hypothetical protein